LPNIYPERSQKQPFTELKGKQSMPKTLINKTSALEVTPSFNKESNKIKVQKQNMRLGNTP
jgi:hypothetical protein